MNEDPGDRVWWTKHARTRRATSGVVARSWSGLEVAPVVLFASVCCFGAAATGTDDGRQPANQIDPPRTGQVTCFDADGASIACATTGQDGDTMTGVAWPSPRLSVIFCGASAPCAPGVDCDGDPINDLVADELTGLVWSRNASPRTSFIQWQGALDYVETTLNVHQGDRPAHPTWHSILIAIEGGNGAWRQRLTG